MHPRSAHLLAEYRGCRPTLLDDLDAVEALMREAAVHAGATVIDALFHRFSPHGVSGVIVIAESHISIHTWPEHGYAAVDFFTCGDARPADAARFLAEALGADGFETLEVERGRLDARRLMSVRSHDARPPPDGPRPASDGRP